MFLSFLHFFPLHNCLCLFDIHFKFLSKENIQILSALLWAPLCVTATFYNNICWIYPFCILWYICVVRPSDFPSLFVLVTLTQTHLQTHASRIFVFISFTLCDGVREFNPEHHPATVLRPCFPHYSTMTLVTPHSPQPSVSQEKDKTLSFLPLQKLKNILKRLKRQTMLMSLRSILTTPQINNQLRYSFHQAARLFLSSQLLLRPLPKRVTSPWRRLPLPDTRRAFFPQNFEPSPMSDLHSFCFFSLLSLFVEGTFAADV